MRYSNSAWPAQSPSPQHPGSAVKAMEASNCMTKDCQGSAVVEFIREGLCLEHFTDQVYELLDNLDPMVRMRFHDPIDRKRMKELLDECTNKALFVSLRCEQLSNLQRSRLLDILLWSGELENVLRTSRSGSLLPADLKSKLLGEPSGEARAEKRDGQMNPRRARLS